MQKADISAAAGQDVAELTVKTFISLRSEENFNFFWKKLQLLTKDLDISEPQLPVIEKCQNNMTLEMLNGNLQFHQKPTRECGRQSTHSSDECR